MSASHTPGPCVHTLRDRLDAERASNLANTKELHRADAEIGRLRQSNADLLAACEALMGLVETAGDFFTDDEQDAQTIRDARAAIAKARGAA